MGNYEIGIFDAGTMNFVDRVSVKNIHIGDIIGDKNVVARCSDHGSGKFLGIINGQDNTIAGYVVFTVTRDKEIRHMGISVSGDVSMSYFYNKDITIRAGDKFISVNFDAQGWENWIAGFHRQEFQLCDGVYVFYLTEKMVMGEPKVNVIDFSYGR